jgi:hypothetical protein
MSDKDSFTGTIVGTVEKVGDSKNGLYARITYKTNPSAQYPERATAWGVKGPVVAGDRVKVSGAISVRKSERDGKTYIDTSNNFPELEVLREAGGAPLGESVGSHDATSEPWASDSTPF